MRAFILAVTGLAFGVIACSSGGTSVEVQRTPVSAVTVVLPAPSLVEGQTARAVATPRDADGNPLVNRPIVWQSSSSAVASVTDSGMISAVAPGSAVISAASEGVSGQASMSVVSPAPAPVASVSVALGATSITPGQTTQASATTRDADNNVLAGRAISWSSSNTSVATVSGSGLISAVAAGTAQISATSEAQIGSATLTVASTPPVPVASVSVTLAASSRNPGQTTQATATTRDANNNVLTGRAITWSSSNTGVATVSGSGLVTAIAVGTVQILAACEGQSGNAALTVVSGTPAPVASVTVALAASSRNPGQTTQATATTRDANNNLLTGRVIAWSSSNTAFATVSASGLVTAVAVGSAQITATSEGQSGGAALTVVSATPAPVASVTVALGTGSLNPGLTTQATATTRDANNNVLTGRAIVWTSNSAVAIVSTSGLVTAVAVGTAQITATSEGQSGSAPLSVQVPGASNEPPGMTVISDRPFNALNELGWSDGGSQGSIVQDATAPISPPSVLRMHMPAGFGEGGGPFSGDHTLPNKRTLYVRYSGMFSSNWQGSSSGVDKTFYVYTSTGVPSIYFNMSGSGVVAKRPQIAGQDIVRAGSPAVGGDQKNPDWTTNLVPGFTVPLGTWHTVELVLVGNTAGNADGSIDWWVNGVHVGSYTGVQFIAGAALWNDFHYTMVYSGSSSSNPTSAQDVFFDHIYLSGN